MGYDDAFGTIHDRYRQRLLAYTRQMLGPSRSDAEDVLQDVFLRAYGALRNDDRPVTLRAWLYRVAHNRCIDHLRRPLPPAAEIYELSRTPTHDPQAETVRREDLRRLVQDVQRLPEQQRSALLMRELDGLTYAELADALDTSVPAIKSLLVRARVGLVEAEEARDAACVDIRADLVRSHGRGVRTSGRSRRHLRDCDACREYRQGLRGVDEGLAALVPGGAGPLAAVAKLLGIGGASSGAAAGAGAGAGGTAAVAGGATAATATATKVVAIVCCAAVVGGGAAEVRQQVGTPAPSGHATHHVRKAVARPAAAVAPVKAPVARAVDPVRDADPPRWPPTRAEPPRRSSPRRGRRRPGHRQRRGAGGSCRASGRRRPRGGADRRRHGARRGRDARTGWHRRHRRSLTHRPGRRARADERAGGVARHRTGLERRCAGRRGCPDHRGRARRADRAFGRTGAIVAPGDGALPDQARARAAARPAPGTRSGRYCIVAVHSTVRGPALGGCRMWRYDDSRAAMRDALRLSRRSTYKSAVAGLPLGGGKGVIMLPDGPPHGRDRTATLLDFADRGGAGRQLHHGRGRRDLRAGT